MSFPSIDESNNYCVEAIAIDETYIYYKCPRCTYRKKPVIHQHGSDNNFKLRDEHRITHCRKGDYEDNGIRGVYIHVTNRTINVSKVKTDIHKFINKL